MKTDTELNAEILKVTMTILKNHPELSKHLREMPVTVPNESDPEVTNKSLRDYLSSLNTLLTTYSNNQDAVQSDEVHPIIKTTTK
jgi:hypothetical protein